jgi:hypothetical protein
MQMLQERYGKYIRSDGDALLRAYVKESTRNICSQKTGTFPGTESRLASKFVNNLASPTRFEPNFGSALNSLHVLSAREIERLRKRKSG